MIHKVGHSETSKAWGKKIKPIKFSYSYDAYATKDELVTEKDELTLDEQLKARNADRRNAARSEQMQKEWIAAGHVKPTLEDDPQMRLQKVFETYIANQPEDKRNLPATIAEGRTMAAQFLGLEWDEDEN